MKKISPAGATQISPALQRWEGEITTQVPEARPIFAHGRANHG